MRARRLTLSLLSVVLVLCACSGSPGGLSGRYRADGDGGTITIDFQGGDKVKVTLASPDGSQQMSHNCEYTVNGDRLMITTTEPMGAPLSLRIVGATLDDGAGTIFSKR